MNLKRITGFVLAVLLFTTTACTGLSSSDSLTATPDIAAIQKPTEPTFPATAPTLLPTSAQPTQAPTAATGTYLVNQRAISTHSTFEEVNLALYRATLTDDRLILRVGFHNVSDQSFYIAGGLGARNLRLIDASGNQYEPVEFSDNLKRLDPPGNFLPGQANVGDVAFPAPAGPAPYELHFPTYAAIKFELNQPAPSAAQPVPEGTYPLAIELYSARSALVPIRLRLDSITITQHEVVVQIAS